MVNGTQRMPTKPLILMKDTSSSSGKVFAKPTKEWVVPERTKPGRKISAEEPDNKRQSQNRLSQRAHRARRSDYITTLEERLRQYEADEVHSNVRLQEVARALKADNERLKRENEEIKSESEELKREAVALKRQLEMSGQARTAVRTLTASPGPSRPRPGPSNTARRPTIDCPICPDPDPDCPCQRPTTSLPSSISSAPLATLSLAAKALEDHDHGSGSGIESRVTLTDSTCGVCRSDEECLCRVLQEGSTAVKPPSEEIHEESRECGLCTSAAFCACRVEVETKPASSGGKSVSLKRPRASGSRTKVWEFTTSSITAAPARAEETTCSGDPSTCQACKDDAFGQEFCTSLYANPTIAKPCDDCPGNCMSISSILNDDAAKRDGSPSREERTMTPDKAWKALKAHPNSKLASLSMLADVVARHTKCVGYDEPIQTTSGSPNANGDGASHRNARAGPPVTPNISGRGFRRRLEVETSGLRDAIRILDQVSPGTPQSTDESSPKRRKVELANDW